MKCVCGNQLDEQDMFCSQCGEKVAQRCQCGTIMKADAKFCTQCGSLRKAEPDSNAEDLDEMLDEIFYKSNIFDEPEQDPSEAFLFDHEWDELVEKTNGRVLGNDIDMLNNEASNFASLDGEVLFIMNDPMNNGNLTLFKLGNQLHRIYRFAEQESEIGPINLFLNVIKGKVFYVRNDNEIMCLCLKSQTVNNIVKFKRNERINCLIAAHDELYVSTWKECQCFGKLYSMDMDGGNQQVLRERRKGEEGSTISIVDISPNQFLIKDNFGNDTFVGFLSVPNKEITPLADSVLYNAIEKIVFERRDIFEYSKKERLDEVLGAAESMRIDYKNNRMLLDGNNVGGRPQHIYNTQGAIVGYWEAPQWDTPGFYTHHKKPSSFYCGSTYYHNDGIVGVCYGAGPYYYTAYHWRPDGTINCLNVGPEGDQNNLLIDKWYYWFEGIGGEAFLRVHVDTMVQEHIDLETNQIKRCSYQEFKDYWW